MPTLEEIRAAGARNQLHLHLNHGHAYQYVCIAEPRIQIVVYRPKRKDQKHMAYQDFVLTGPNERFQTLDEAVAALQRRDDQKARDLEWDAAAPTTGAQGNAGTSEPPPAPAAKE